MNIKIIKLDINKPIYEKIQAKQGDTKSRYLLFHLLDGAIPFSLNGRTVRVYGLKPDNKEIFNDLQIVDATRGICKLELTSQALAVPGNLDLELVIMEGESKLSSIPFVVEVLKSLNSKSAIESSNEYKALDRSLIEVEAWNKEFAEKSGKLEELYTPRLNEVSSQLAEKAKQSDLNTTNARISDIVANNGNGTKDVELVDARKGKITLRDKIDEVDTSIEIAYNRLLDIKSTNISIDNLTINSNNCLCLKTNLITNHKNFVWLKNDYKNIGNVSFDFYIDSTNNTFRPAFKCRDGRIIWFNFQKSSSGTLGLILYNKDVTVLKQFGTEIPFSDGFHNCKINRIGTHLFLYMDNTYVTKVDITNYISEMISGVGINFRGDTVQNTYLKDYKVEDYNIKFAHFSLDDQFDCLKDITTNKDIYTSIFDSVYFAPLKKLHEQYGVVFTLELFYQWEQSDPSFTLSNVTNKFKEEFTKCSHWLKFAYHGTDIVTLPKDVSVEILKADISKTYAEITRFACENSIDRIPRLSSFSCTKEQAIELRSEGLTLGYLTADDNRSINTGLTSSENIIMQNYERFDDYTNRISYFRSMPRLDTTDYPTQELLMNKINSIYNTNLNNRQLIIFCHKITNDEMKNRLEMIAKWCSDKGYSFEYPINYLTSQ